MAVWIFLLAIGAFLVAFGVFLVFALIAIWFGAPFVPTSRERVRVMIELADLKPGELVADFGSGEGCLLRAAARAGAKVTGWEINPALVVWSRAASRLTGLASRITIRRGSFWSAPVVEYDVIFAYLLPETMKRFGEKILREARPGVRVVANAFPITGWPLDDRRGNVYRYRVPTTQVPSLESPQCPSSGPPFSTILS